MTRRNADDPDPPGGRAAKRLEQFRKARNLPAEPPMPGAEREGDDDCRPGEADE